MDNVSDLTIEVLKDIRAELRELKGEVVGLKGEVVELKGGLHELNERVAVGFAGTSRELSAIRGEVTKTNTRLDAVLKIAGTHHGELESRVQRIEDHLGLTSG